MRRPHGIGDKAQGQGEATEKKAEGLARLFSINLTIFDKKCRGTYYHFDLNSGAGYNDECDCIGSPLVFVRATREEGCERWRGYFVDHNEEVFEALGRFEEMRDQRVTTVCADNAHFIDRIPALVGVNAWERRHAVGMVFSDPNGAHVPIEQLAWLAPQCPKLDFAIHWNSSIVKRCNGLDPARYPTHAKTNLIEALQALGKRYWLIRRPVGNWQFTLLVGRNIKTNDDAKAGFYALDSQQGQHILQQCSYSEKERAGMYQGVLF